MSYKLLQNVTKDDLRLDPYPHVVIKNALPSAECDKLVDEFPADHTIAKSANLGSNQRFNYSSFDILNDSQINEHWKKYVQANTGKDFFEDFVDIFGDALKVEYPAFYKKYILNNAFKTGIWGANTQHDGGINVAADINSPVLKTSSVQRGPHLDQPNKLIFGLLYLRPPEDTTPGGDLEIYKLKNKKSFKFERNGRHIDAKYIELVDTVKYEKNTLVLGLNTLRSIHGLTPREPTKVSRRFSNFFIELKKPLFDPKETSWDD